MGYTVKQPLPSVPVLTGLCARLLSVESLHELPQIGIIHLLRQMENKNAVVDQRIIEPTEEDLKVLQEVGK